MEEKRNSFISCERNHENLSYSIYTQMYDLS